jgi:S1-C subfamily serine protease
MAATAALVAVLAAGEARGQADEAAVVVEGRVRAVYQGDDRLVELEARRAELGGLPLGNARLDVPSPGDLVYIHTTGAPPAAGGEARAFLVPRKEGGWLGRFEPIGKQPQPQPRTMPAPAPVPASGGLAALGLTAEDMEVKGSYALKVTAVDRSKPAGRAGLEVGDIVVGLEGKPLTGPRDLDARVAKGGETSLMVVDINTGKVAQVPVDLGKPTASAPAPAPTPAPEAAPRRSLGITAEPVKIEGKGALKVVKVDPAGAGAKAGLEPGDVLVAADGKPLAGPEQLAAALRKGGPVVELLVRDTRTGKDVPVPVRFGSATPSPAPMARPKPAPAGPGTESGIGAATELVFLDTEVAVKVTAVTPGGPAARAGLEPGDVIVEAAGKPVLHPDELAEAAKQATGTLQLTVLPQGSGRRTAVKVDLGR